MAVPDGVRARADRGLALPPRARRGVERSVRRAGGADSSRSAALRRVVGRVLAVTGGARPGLLRRVCARSSSLDALRCVTRRVRDRQQPPRGAVAPRDRVRPGRAGDEDPRQVPALARGGAVRAAPVRDVRQGLPAHVRRLPRPRRPAVRRRVQLPLRRPATTASGGRAAPRRGRERRNRRLETSVVLLVLAVDLDRDGRRDQRLEDVRTATRRRRGRDPRRRSCTTRSPSTIPTSRSRPSAAPRTSPSTGAARRARSCSRAP